MKEEREYAYASPPAMEWLMPGEKESLDIVYKEM